MNPTLTRLALCFFALAETTTAFGADGLRYTVVDLGKSVEPVAINASGDVVGAVRSDDNQSHVFLFSHGQMRNLGALTGQIGIARNINARGQIVGEYGQGHAFLYASASGVLEDLSSSAKNSGESLTSAYGINAAGQIIGQTVVSGNYHAVVYSKTKLEPLGSLEGKIGRSEGHRINASGQVAGVSSTSDGSEHAFLFSQGKMTDLGTLGGKDSLVNDLNDAGQVVGHSPIRDGHIHAFLYANGHMQDLGVPPSGEALAYDRSEAKGINNAGLIVGWGYRYTADGFLKIILEGKAFIYSNQRWTDLNSQVNLAGTGLTRLFMASVINDAGQIAGLAFAVDGPHGFLLTPK